MEVNRNDCADFCPAHNFLWFDIGLPYLVNGSFIIRRYVSCIHDPDMTLNFDLKVIGFLTNFLDRSITYFWIDIGLPYLAHGCITIKRCVTYIHDRDSMLSFPLTSRAGIHKTS